MTTQGNDETVLWEGAYVGGTFPDITLSESYKNFEYLEITLTPDYVANYPRSEVIQKFPTDNLALEGACMSFTVTTFNSDNSYSYVHFISYKMASETVIQAQFQSMYRQTIPVNTGNVSLANGRRDSSSAYEYGITKVKGIGRKEL